MSPALLPSVLLLACGGPPTPPDPAPSAEALPELGGGGAFVPVQEILPYLVGVKEAPPDWRCRAAESLGHSHDVGVLPYLMFAWRRDAAPCMDAAVRNGMSRLCVGDDARLPECGVLAVLPRGRVRFRDPGWKQERRWIFGFEPAPPGDRASFCDHYLSLTQDELPWFALGVRVGSLCPSGDGPWRLRIACQRLYGWKGDAEALSWEVPVECAVGGVRLRSPPP